MVEHICDENCKHLRGLFTCSKRTMAEFGLSCNFYARTYRSEESRTLLANGIVFSRYTDGSLQKPSLKVTIDMRRGDTEKAAELLIPLGFHVGRKPWRFIKYQRKLRIVY